MAMKEVLRKKLGVSESEWKEMMEHLREYCHLSDEGVILAYGENADVDAIIEKMTDAEFAELALPILQKMMEDLKIKKKKAKKKAKVEEKESSSDSDSDSDSDGETTESEEQQVEQECESNE